MKTDLMNIIFGMKVRKARTEMDMSLSAFAKEAGLSASYLTEIEKGRKYPKRDKILKIAEVTGKDYDELVSIRLDPSLKYLESALQSPLLSEFPFDEFGVELGSLVDVLTNAPDKTSALIQALFDIGRRYDMKEEHFLHAAMRSLQEMYDNHFPEIEESAEITIKQHSFSTPPTQEELENVLINDMGYDIDYDLLLKDSVLAGLRSVLVKGKRPRLLINNRLTKGQQKFLMAREIGMRALKLKDRAHTSPPLEIDSFDQVLNNFKASYFAGAIMMPREAILADLETFFELETFQPEHIMAIMNKYEASPEMLCYRISELVTHHFGIDIHFLRFNDGGGRYQLIKHLNMNNLPLPAGTALREHYCRRWLTVRLLREIQQDPPPPNRPHIGVQMSEFLNKGSKFLCIGFSRSMALEPGINTSVNIGFRVTPGLSNTIKFADDPNIPHTIISDTCERCSLTYEQCSVRAVDSRKWDRQVLTDERKAALQNLMAELRG